MQDTAGEARTNSLVTFFYGPLHMDMQVLADQQVLSYNGFVWTQDTDSKTYRERLTIGTNDKRESGKSVLAARIEDIYIHRVIQM